MNAGNMLADEQFVMVSPALVRACGSMSRAAVLQHLWWARDRQTGRTTLTQAAIADATGLSPRSVERATGWLREAGVLVRGKVSAFDHTSVWVVHPAAAAILAGSFSPSGGTEADKVAGSDSDKVAGSSYENPKNTLPSEGSNVTPLIPAPSEPTPTDAAFDAFWAAYPRHTDRAKARRAWDKAHRLAPLDVILAGVQRLVAEQREPQFIPHPTTWLNGRRWEDEPLPAARAARDRQAHQDRWTGDGGGFFGQAGSAGR